MAYTTIDDPSAHFQVKRYSGTNANQSLTNDGNSDLQPDLIFASYLYGTPPYTNHRAIIDSSRGRAEILESDTTAAEATTTNAAYDLVSFDTDGFTVGAVNSTSALNASGINHIAWQWKCNGGTTTSKSSGTVAGNVTTPCVQQVNTDAGFSIITYTASSSYAGTETHLEHGLGVGPRFLMVKRRDASADWAVYHAGNGGSPNAGYSYNVLNSDAARATSSTYWLNTPAESNATLLAFGNNASVGADGGEYVCYAFAEKQGYSKFGSYIGNGGTGGKNNFVYTGFKPAFVMVKRTDSTSNWAIATNYNNVATNGYIWANNNNTQGNGAIFITATGFKITSTAGGYGASGGTYIYIAFAEYPIVTSKGAPATAR